MSRVARLGLFVAVSLLVPAGASGLTTPVEAAPGTTLSLHGRLIVVRPESPGDVTGYAVALADGDLVPVQGAFASDIRTGAVFDGRVALPSEITTTLARRGETGATAALRLVDRRSTDLHVVGTPQVTQSAPTPPTSDVGTTHVQYVAAVDNKGSLGQTDAQILAHVATVGTYWTHQANGAIASVAVPAVVKHFTTPDSATCGLGSGQAGVNDFFNLLQEAAQQFPGIDLTGSSPAQLVLFVPPSCSSGTTVGRGTIGSSFASGGMLVAESSDSIDGVYAHETGHNYGFQHAYAGLGATPLEYYGVYDVMGFALAGYNQLTALSTPFRVFQGIVDPGEIQEVDLGDGQSSVHATATIVPRSDDTGVRSVRVSDPDTGEPLYLDYRAGTGADAGAFYTATGFHLTSDSQDLYYARGVTINAAYGIGGSDTLVLDARGDTSLTQGASWTNASGDLTVTVTSLGAAGATVDVDYVAPQPFTTTGTPQIGGVAKVGGTVTLDVGTWSPTPTTTQVRWTADGSAVPSLDDLTSFVAGPGLLGKQLVATVTQKRSGYLNGVAASAGVTVGSGTITVTTAPSWTGTPKVGYTLHAQTGAWSAVLSPVTSTFHWQRGGVDIPGADASDYQVGPADVGSTISVRQSLVATGYTTASSASTATGVVPEPVIDPAPAPTIGGTPRVGTALSVDTGSWMDGVALTTEWYVDGLPTATGSSYTPTAADLGKAIRVEVTGTRADYPTVTRTSPDSAAVAPGVLTKATPTISGTPRVGKTLTARHGTWSAGTTFRYAWYADGKVVKHQTGVRLRLTKAQRGHRITVKVTGTKAGYTTASRTSARTGKVR